MTHKMSQINFCDIKTFICNTIYMSQKTSFLVVTVIEKWVKYGSISRVFVFIQILNVKACTVYVLVPKVTYKRREGECMCREVFNLSYIFRPLISRHFEGG